jgi:hypothetical protein
MYMKGNRSDLNKLAIDHGGLPQSFQQIRSRHAERQRQGREGPAAQPAEPSLAQFLAVARSEFSLEPLHVLAPPSSNEPAHEHADAQHDPDAQKPEDEMRAHR